VSAAIPLPNSGRTLRPPVSRIRSSLAVPQKSADTPVPEREQRRVAEELRIRETRRWLGTDVDGPDTDWTEVAELLDASWRHRAPARLLRC
jgi:hypothetical protein